MLTYQQKEEELLLSTLIQQLVGDLYKIMTFHKRELVLSVHQVEPLQIQEILEYILLQVTELLQ